MGETEAIKGGVNETPNDPPDDEDEWIRIAWRARLTKRPSWRALARQFGVHHETVKRQVVAYSKVVADAYQTGDVDSLAEYVEGTYEDMKDADRLAREGLSEQTRIVAIGKRQDFRQRIAAAKGVVTERNGHEVTGANGGPILIVNEFSPEVLHGNASAQAAAFALAAAVTGGTGAGEPADVRAADEPDADDPETSAPGTD